MAAAAFPDDLLSHVLLPPFRDANDEERRLLADYRRHQSSSESDALESLDALFLLYRYGLTSAPGRIATKFFGSVANGTSANTALLDAASSARRFFEDVRANADWWQRAAPTRTYGEWVRAWLSENYREPSLQFLYSSFANSPDGFRVLTDAARLLYAAEQSLNEADAAVAHHERAARAASSPWLPTDQRAATAAALQASAGQCERLLAGLEDLDDTLHRDPWFRIVRRLLSDTAAPGGILPLEQSAARFARVEERLRDLGVRADALCVPPESWISPDDINRASFAFGRERTEEETAEPTSHHKRRRY
ncbi:Hypothetical protein UVM_LOCUS417 [uncultured virus]|nr:Hypothetical protein UVM_LOCUS417 [uncultured virus]